jgi:hypothetical protein
MGPGVSGPVTVRSMTTYSGPARLTLADGTRVSGMASLSTNQRGGIDGWGGTFRPDQVSADIRNASDGLYLELPYEQIGAVSVTGVRKLLATQILMSMAGQGPAPF